MNATHEARARVRGNCAHLFIDQYGNKWWARSQRELREKIGGGKISAMYVDKLDGRTVRCGVVVGQHWCTEFAPVEKKVQP